MKHEMGINAKIKEVSTKRVRNNRSMIRKKAVESLKLKAETLRGWGCSYRNSWPHVGLTAWFSIRKICANKLD